MNSKSKGNKFERDVCKKLSLWFSDGKRDDLFWRTASSGGRFTQRLKVGKDTINQAGDITNTCSDSEELISKCMIECKSYKDIKIWTLITGVEIKDSVLEWWNITKKKSDDLSKVPVLIVRQNRKPDLFITNVNMSNILSPISFFPKLNIFIYNLEDVVKLPYVDFISQI